MCICMYILAALNSRGDRVTLLGDYSVILPAGRFISYNISFSYIPLFMCSKRLFSFVLYGVIFCCNQVYILGIFFIAALAVFSHPGFNDMSCLEIYVLVLLL